MEKMQVEPTDPSTLEREQIKILPIRTGWLIKSKEGWFAFATMLEVSNHLFKLRGKQ